jgi:glycosyltransferase involved in cell wall biosynthesis
VRTDCSPANGGPDVVEMWSRRDSKPLVSVITAVKDCRKYLEQSIGSVLSQTYRPLEYIVVDGQSTDGTVDLIKRYQNRITRWLSEPDRNHFDAMNKGSQLATGDYALYLNADDYLFSPTAIEDLMRAVDNAAEAPALLVGRCIFAFQDQLLPVVKPPCGAALKKYGLPHQATLLHSRIYKHFPYNSALCVSADTDLWNRLRSAGMFDPYFAPVDFSVFRVGGLSTSLAKEFSRHIESQISLYMCSKQFSITALLRGMLLTRLKRVLYWATGERFYFCVILPWYFRLWRR